MNYTQSVEYIHSRLKFGIRPGLERIEKLCALLGNPQDKLKFIHVAGTNGKGSICAMLSAICRKAGLKTGLFISPYVVDFRERITINGEYIPKEDFASIITKIKPLADSIEDITEFEILTAAAFVWYCNEQCDIVVLEVGLGGRFDSTNIIKTPVCSVIGKIAIDHTNILGDTIVKIAHEKCGIIKQGCPVITYPEQDLDALTVIMEHICCKGSELYTPNSNAVSVISESIFGTQISYNNAIFDIPFAGQHQIYNALTAIESAKVIGFTDKTIAQGIKMAYLPARVEVLSRAPLVIVDGSHNSNGISALASLINKHLKNKKITFIIGMLADKSVEEAASIILPHASSVITVTPDNPRAMSAQELAEIALKYCRNTISCNNVEEACRVAINNCNKDEAIICCGSLYLAGDIIKAFRKIL